ncbi:1,2-phenylacetyl-CoA epoxidase subunit PaaD [Streptomyces sp. NPDC048242]|uniref:1,2-phenylacetyl-CoA epoxidase subunit PaaD n=1 Tax=Streptomyces sp. NPDC048242 TaxID=3155026 RepID=UPI00341C6CA0
MVTATALEAELLELAGSVPDPELPVLTLHELGVVRAVRVGDSGSVEVDLTPTYTGCPAVEAMSADIERLLHEHGVHEVRVRTVLSPAWSTDDITAEGRRKLESSGIAPPRPHRATGPVALSLSPTHTGAPTRTGAANRTGGHGTDAAAGAADPLRCPHCHSTETELLSRFSSTACKALRRCLSCREPFDHFKEL